MEQVIVLTPRRNQPGPAGGAHGKCGNSSRSPLNHFYRSSAEKGLGKIIKEHPSAVCVYDSPPGKGAGCGGSSVAGDTLGPLYSVHYKALGRALGTELSTPFFKATRYRGL